MKYTAIIIASAAFAFCVQAYAKAQAYMDYTTDAAFIDVDAIDPYENIRDEVARHEMREAARITREREVEIAQMYEQLNAGERMRGDAEVK
ncbi:hypothetical protein [Neisseria sicca]|uniref:hypothetical protein n=1 Tax=Neisseria sicca TaxID=490 RepID=UPI000D2F85A7|nr:hypothetical protein [Neisseria sicca]